MRVLLWFTLFAVSGCVFGRGKRATSVRANPAVFEADTLWDLRDSGGLQPVEDVLTDAWQQSDADDPEILWRLARVHTVMGIIEEGDRRVAIDRYAQGRALAMRCLDASPAWKQRRLEGGLEAALEVATDEHLPCIAWASVAWSRWIAMLGGEAAALDFDDVELLAGHAASQGDDEVRSLAVWASALVAVSRPQWARRDEGRARTLMDRAIELAPGDLPRQWDLLIRIALPQEDAALAQQTRSAIAEARADSPEDRAVQQRAGP